MVDASDQTLKSAPPPSDAASSPDVKTKSMRGQSEWVKVGQTVPKVAGAEGRTSLTSSFSHNDGISDQMVRGGFVRKVDDDPTQVSTQLKNQKSAEPFDIAKESKSSKQ